MSLNCYGLLLQRLLLLLLLSSAAAGAGAAGGGGGAAAGGAGAGAGAAYCLLPTAALRRGKTDMQIDRYDSEGGRGFQCTAPPDLT